MWWNCSLAEGLGGHSLMERLHERQNNVFRLNPAQIEWAVLRLAKSMLTVCLFD